MQIRRGKPPGSGRLARTGVELSREARVRLAWMDFYGRCCNVVHTCRDFGISRQTFYRWQRRYDPYDLTTLEERSHCPRQRRLPTWSKLTPWTCVPSPAWSLNSSPPAIWFRAGTCCRLTPAPPPKPRLSSSTLLHRMPFPIRAVQIDGGPEFAAEFEQACQQRGLHLFVLPPRSPKLNGAVERANRTHTEEFYQVTACSLEMKKLNRELRHWEKIYNTVRPHQALGYLTPLQFLRQISSQRKE